MVGDEKSRAAFRLKKQSVIFLSTMHAHSVFHLQSLPVGVLLISETKRAVMTSKYPGQESLKLE